MPFSDCKWGGHQFWDPQRGHNLQEVHRSYGLVPRDQVIRPHSQKRREIQPVQSNGAPRKRAEGEPSLYGSV